MSGWEYLHEFVESQQMEGTGKRSFFGLGAERMRSVYAWDDINERLNELGDEGWELLHAEPHWIWSTQTIGAPLWVAVLDDKRRRVEAATSYPEHIVGWYCTFRRPSNPSRPAVRDHARPAVPSGFEQVGPDVDPSQSDPDEPDPSPWIRATAAPRRIGRWQVVWSDEVMLPAGYEVSLRVSDTALEILSTQGGEVSVPLDVLAVVLDPSGAAALSDEGEVFLEIESREGVTGAQLQSVIESASRVGDRETDPSRKRQRRHRRKR